MILMAFRIELFKLESRLNGFKAVHISIWGKKHPKNLKIVCLTIYVCVGSNMNSKKSKQ